MFKSTRSNETVNSYEAIVNGLSNDLGLYTLQKIKKINIDESWVNLSYKEIAKIVLSSFFDDFKEEEIDYIISNAYSPSNFKNKIIDTKVINNTAFLELYHGNTYAFKDMALSALPYFLEVSMNNLNIDKKIKVLVATSGDTGSAVLNAFKNNEKIETIVLYPNNGVSTFQENQMLSFTSKNSKAIALDNNFDECQTLVKEIFNENKSNKDLILTSANSINIARLIPQVVYYYKAYFDLVNKGFIKYGESINVSVPTGNFGDILACFYAKESGLFINKLICASNKNDVLTEFFNTGVYNANREFYKTNSPSMDILISSNLERLLNYKLGDTKTKELMDSLKTNKSYKIDNINDFNEFIAYKTDEDEIKERIKELYINNNYLIDPHTACAYDAAIKSNLDKTLVVSTASPYKFMDTINEVIKNVKQEIIIDNKFEKVVLSKEEVKEFVLMNPKCVKTYATTSNIGVGFDTLGMKLDLYNEFKYSLFNKYLICGFTKEYNNESNLVIKAYKEVVKEFNLIEKPIYLEMIENNIPFSRGLGSSATLYLAGVLIAKDIYKLNDTEKLINIMVKLEGHPDNIVSSFMGSLVSSYKIGDSYKSIKYQVSDKLKFYIGYPDYEVSTEDARKILKDSYSREDVVNNLSRIANVPYAFKNGDYNLLKELLIDKIHEPYRKTLIKEYDYIKEFMKDCITLISGSGSTLFFISDKTLDFNILNLNNWVFKEVKVKED